MKAVCLIFCFLVVNGFGRAVAQEEPLSEYLWSQTIPEQQAALNSYLVQGLKNGTFDPTEFGGFMVQDVAYIYWSYRYLTISSGRATDPDLKDFLQLRANSFESLYRSLSVDWHILDVNGTVIGNALNNYLWHLHDMSHNWDPIYFTIAAIPCVKLWPWIGNQIQADVGNFGVYTSWVKENFDPTYKGYELYDVMINHAYTDGNIDQQTALDVFRKSMQGEVDFFTHL